MSKSRKELQDYLMGLVVPQTTEPVFEADCDMIIQLLDNCEITIPKEKEFFVEINCDGVKNYISNMRSYSFATKLRAKGYDKGEKTKSYIGLFDYSHTCPEWDVILGVGIVGLKKRVETYLKYSFDEKKIKFYKKEIEVYDAVLRFIDRCADKAFECGKERMAKGLKNLTVAAPSNLFEALQTTIVYYVLQHSIEGTFLRTLGKLDRLLYAFYEKEDKALAKELLYSYIAEIDTLRAPANIPFAIGGTKMDGSCAVNELTYLLLKAYRKVPTSNTKLHLLCAPNTPEDLIKYAFDGIKEGHNSIVMMNDEVIIKGLVKLGAEYEDAFDYHVVGCYECGAKNELTCTCNGRVNLVKAIETTLNKGREMYSEELVGLENSGNFETFEAFFNEFLRQTKCFCENTMEMINLYEEEYYRTHSSPIMNATFTSALSKGADLYGGYAAKYNTSSIDIVGLATVVDSIIAIKKLVWEDKTLTLSELVEILKSDWEGHEPLRLFVKNKFAKFGQNNPEVDVYATIITEYLNSIITGVPNVKGGKYRFALISINWCMEFGKLTAASADGRHKGETLSQNTSASFGADKEGATAHLLSLTAIDATNLPNGCIADIDLHSSAVQGEAGTNAMYATLRTYFEKGGLSVHYNVLNTDVLKKARENPELYPNLQVRLCGWNVLFSSLSNEEKDLFIARSAK